MESHYLQCIQIDSGLNDVPSIVASAVDIMVINANFSFKAIYPEILLNHIHTYNYSKFFSDLIL